MTCVPSMRDDAPLVTTLVVVPAATALPMVTPSERIDTVAPATVPPTVNNSDFPDVELLRLVILSVEETPLSLDGSRSGATGVPERFVELTLKKLNTAAI